MRRAQIEMVGLVMVVVLLVLGILLYLQLGSKTSNIPATSKTAQAGNAFLTALAETDVPTCKVRFSEVARACARAGISDRLPCADPCAELQQVLERTAKFGLQNYKYNVSLVGTAVQVSENCRSADPAVNLAQAPQLPIVFGDGRVANLTLAICR